MLERVPETIDKREGSIIYMALAPAAAELAQMYIELDVIMNETFADTASREYLIRRASERGIVPKQATKSILKGTFNIDVEIGSRFSLDDLNYEVIEKISEGVYKLQCETAGELGNAYFGELIPVDYIEGLETAELTELLIPGVDAEETEVFRSRYFDSLDSQAFGGNVSDYKEKVSALNGVGGVKVYPVWNGAGTVKIVIINSSFQKPSTELVESVQTTIDPVVNQGEGVGIAPIGHTVTVEGVAETTVNISTNITFQEGWTIDGSRSYIENAIDTYFDELAKNWGSQTKDESLIVRISQIEIRLLNVPGILDIADTTLNGSAQNLVLTSTNIPKRGDFNVQATA